MAVNVHSVRENRRAIRNVGLLTALFLISLWGFFVYWAVSHRQETIATAENSLSQMTHAVEQYVRNVVKMAEVFQATAERWLDENDVTDPSTDPGLVSLIEDYRQRTSGLIDIRMITANGDLYYFPGDPTRPVDNVADREYFRAAMQAAPGVSHIGIPVVSRVSGKWRLPITMRMARPHHGLLVINASIDLSEMIGTFDSERPKPNGSISFWREDGTLLVRAPHAESAVGKPISEKQLLWRAAGGEFSGSLRVEDTPIDGIERLVSYKRLKGYPLVVLVTAALNDTLEPWRRQVIMVSIALFFVTIWGALFSGQLIEALRKLGENTQELERLATEDSLTGLFNRRYLMQTGAHEVARMRRYGSPMALMLLDVDNFKEINDTWGHPVGDRVLLGLARVMNAIVRDQDIVGRLGGEEFAIMLPETDAEGAVVIAERMRAAVQAAEMTVTEEGGAVRITVSIGFTTLAPENDSFDAALVRADKALYRAKESGRNCVVKG